MTAELPVVVAVATVSLARGKLLPFILRSDEAYFIAAMCRPPMALGERERFGPYVEPPSLIVLLLV
jgi:hypothetical protein